MNIVFAKTRTEYTPYADFWRIVSLSGYEIRYLDEVDWQASDTTVIATPRNGEWNIPKDRRVKFVHWMLERPRPGNDDMAEASADADEIWSSCRAMANAFGFRYVFMGGHKRFANINILHRKDYDLIALMYWSPRRATLRGDLLERDLKLVDPNGDCWGDKREWALNSSKLMINAHQDDLPWCEPIKFAIAGMYAMPLLSEICADAGLWQDSKAFVTAPIHELADYAKWMLQDEVKLAQLGGVARRLVCDHHPFRAEVDRAVQA